MSGRPGPWQHGVVSTARSTPLEDVIAQVDVLRASGNHRTDGYGGPVGNRVRLLREVAEAVAL